MDRFGTGIVTPEGELDRPALAALVFGDPDELADLNAIVHPAVGAEIMARMAAEADTDHVVVLDVPLLVESGRSDMAGLVVVDVATDVAIGRLVGQRGVSEADARARMSRQASREARLAVADRVVDNNGTREDLERQVEALWGWITGLTPTDG